MKTIPIPEMSNIQKKRFWNNVSVRGDGECWPFNMYKNSRGYGVFGIGQKTFYAHRVAFFLVCGDIPENMLVLHKCDNPECCNPNHHFLGDTDANMKDMKAKKRSTFGERSWDAKLTEEQVKYIISVNGSRKRGTGYRALGKKFGVDRTTIREIAKGVNWSYLHTASSMTAKPRIVFSFPPLRPHIASQEANEPQQK